MVLVLGTNRALVYPRVVYRYRRSSPEFASLSRRKSQQFCLISVVVSSTTGVVSLLQLLAGIAEQVLLLP
ncbi:hypothetical protein V2J09_006019 [Rumex salicifolius]